MQMAAPARYAIIDIETTGGDPRVDRITEICILLHDGQQVLEQFTSLVNPQMAIPEFITRITGIDNDMVREAPKFYEIARRVVEMTQDAVFVAHNVRFDYSFVQKEFRQLGYPFQRKQLCTVKLSRRLLPGFSSYGLRNLCEQLGITNEARHRAWGDAQATARLFEQLMTTHRSETSLPLLQEEMARIRLPRHLDPARIEDLPEEAGVYYFHDQQGRVIYVGKSTDIRKRVMSHFQGAHKQARTLHMVDMIHDLSWELTGNELIALLLENEEIKRLQPAFNIAQRRKGMSHGIYAAENDAGFIEFRVDKYRESEGPVAGFSSRSHAEAGLQRRARAHLLCPKLYGAEKGPERCFQYQLKGCLGACCGEESPEAYNERANALIRELTYGREDLIDFLVVGAGRHYEERSVVWISRGRYWGFGFIDKHIALSHSEMLEDHIPRRPDSPEIARILRYYVKRHPREVLLLPRQDSRFERQA
jgi:DNA polymerase-3 subunit epsilon